MQNSNSNDSIFPIKLYIYGPDGRHGGAIDIVSEAQLNGAGTQFIVRDAIQRGVEVIMTDPMDFCVFHAKDGKVLFPAKEELLAEKEQRDAAEEECPTCRDIREKHHGFGPSHNGSPHCQSGSIASGGQNAHCSCDTCF